MLSRLLPPRAGYCCLRAGTGRRRRRQPPQKQQQEQQCRRHEGGTRCLSTSPPSTDWRAVLKDVSDGRLAVAEAERLLSPLVAQGIESLGDYAKVDHLRWKRTGFPEVVYGEGKTAAQLQGILESMIVSQKQQEEEEEQQQQQEEAQQVPYVRPIVATRVSPEKWAELSRSPIEGLQYRPEARVVIYGGDATLAKAGKVVVMSAGTSDQQVAEECALLVEVCGFRVERVYDCGVAGIHRLFANLHKLRDAKCCCVVAGMDGALPAVVGGLVACPVVAVPTSVGYGACFSGVAPLLTMLNACAPGVSVVNIDNGFGAAAMAVKILHQSR